MSEMLLKAKCWDTFQKEMLEAEKLTISIECGRLTSIWYQKTANCSFGSTGSYLDTKRYIILPFSGCYARGNKEIYKDDIVRIDESWAKLTGAGRKNCLVGFKDGGFMYGRYRLEPKHLNSYLWMISKTDFQDAKCTIISNFHQNPELLTDEIKEEE